MDEEFAKALEAIEQPYLDRQTLIKNLLFSGLKQYRIELAMKKYLDGEVSTWKAAEIAGVSLRKMTKILQEKGVEMHYSLIDEEDAREVAGATGLKIRGCLYVLKEAIVKGLISKEEAIETLDEMIKGGSATYTGLIGGSGPL